MYNLSLINDKYTINVYYTDLDVAYVYDSYISIYNPPKCSQENCYKVLMDYIPTSKCSDYDQSTRIFNAPIVGIISYATYMALIT